MIDRKMSELENALVSKAMRGDKLICPRMSPDSLRRTTSHAHVIHADLILDLLLGRLGHHLHPRGIGIRYAHIVSDAPIDMRSMTFPVGIHLKYCVFDSPVIAHDVEVPWLCFDDCEMPYFHADRIRVEGSLFLRGLRTTGAHRFGSVRLLGAKINGNLEADGTTLHNTAGAAIHAEGIHIGRSLFFRNSDAVVNCDTGAVQLVNATIGGDVRCDNTHIRNNGGPVLNAETAHVSGSVLLCRNFVAEGSSSKIATINLVAANIQSRLDFGSGHKLVGLSHHAPSPEDPGKPAKVLNSGQGLAIDLRCASATRLCLPPDAICDGRAKNCDDGRRFQLAGLRYSTLSSECSAYEPWLHLLDQHTHLYEAEPYHQLATVMQAAGHERDARRVLIRQQARRYQAYKPKWWPARAWHWVKHVVIGYGYKPWGALIGLGLVFVLALALSWFSHRHSLIEHFPLSTPYLFQPCSGGEAMKLAADLSIPLINTGGRLRCDFKADTSHWWYLAGLGLQIFGWAFTTLFVAGFSGVVRKVQKP
ncbi:hypothetical protein ABZ345_00120 [Lentzea sp. NPDC005914]|uniref:hypothetical protein n=1 Tax=Lentzea sp. NPDC005914 TaxID=3154572 RepID=UPI0034045C0B